MIVEFLANLLLQVVLLAAINAELVPETKSISENNTNFQNCSTGRARIETQQDELLNDLKINNNTSSLYNRNSRQVPSLFQNKQPGFSTSFLNRLNTHGLAITGNIGLGVRYASGNSYNGDGTLAHQNHRENTNNVYDRYLGTTFNIGTNLHMLNKEDDHSSYQNGLTNRKDDDTAKVLSSDNTSTTKGPTIWKRINQYLPKYKLLNGNGSYIDCGDDSENCTAATANNVNILTKLLTKHFHKFEPRNFPDNGTTPEVHFNALENEIALNDVDVDHNSTNLFNKVTNYFNRYKLPSIIEQIWNDRSNIIPKSNNSLTIKNDYNSFRNVVRDFLVERISSYITQNSTNDNFMQKFLKRALSQLIGDYTTQETKQQLVDELEEKNTLWNYLSQYFNNERFKKFFPDIETIRNNFVSSQWFYYEGSYPSGWLKNNFSNLFNKHPNGTSAKI